MDMPLASSTAACGVCVRVGGGLKWVLGTGHRQVLCVLCTDHFGGGREPLLLLGQEGRHKGSRCGGGGVCIGRDALKRRGWVGIAYDVHTSSDQTPPDRSNRSKAQNNQDSQPPIHRSIHSILLHAGGGRSRLPGGPRVAIVCPPPAGAAAAPSCAPPAAATTQQHVHTRTYQCCRARWRGRRRAGRPSSFRGGDRRKGGEAMSTQHDQRRRGWGRQGLGTHGRRKEQAPGDDSPTISSSASLCSATAAKQGFMCTPVRRKAAPVIPY